MNSTCPKFKVINYVAHYRKLHNLTQSQLASFVGVSKNTISSIERGLFNPSLSLIAVLCFALGVRFEELFVFEYHRSDGVIVKYKF